MNKNLNKILIYSIIGVVFLMSMGYSVLNRELSISGELTYRPDGDVRITNIVQKELSNATIQYADFSRHEIKLAYTSLTASASVTYEVEITNFSNTEMGILKIDGLPTDAEIKGYSLGTKLTNIGGTLLGGDSTTFTITFKSNTIETKPLLLSFDFEPVYTITYEGFSNTSGYKKEVLNKDNFIEKLGNVQICSVMMSGVAISEYTYKDETIEIKEVSGNIVINGGDAVEETPITTPNAPVLNGDMIPVRYEQETLTTGKWVKADVTNKDNDWYDYANQKWANAVTVSDDPTVIDLSTNKNNGTTHNGVVTGNGLATFDGVDDYIDTGLRFSGNNITLVLRFKFNALPTDDQFRFFNNNGNTNILYNLSNQFKFTYTDNSEGYKEIALKKEVNLNDYYTVVGTYNGTTMSIYVNGEKASADILMTSRTSSANFTIGGQVNSGKITRASNITVSDALIFNYGLSEEEIMEHYSGEVSLGETAPMLYYDFKNTASREYIKNAPVGTPVEDYMNTMWVWIPRYSYTIKKEACSTDYYGKGTYGNETPTKDLPGEIDVKFIPTTENDTGSAQYSNNSNTNSWRTNDAFNFPETNEVGENTPTPRAGIWVGKNEIAGSLSKDKQACTNDECNVTKITIKPGQKSLTNQNVSSFFFASRSMQNDTETFGFDKTKGNLHMAKVDEWGAVAYLSHSRYGKYGNNDYEGANKEIYYNSDETFKTGRSSGTPGGIVSEDNFVNKDMTDLGVDENGNKRGHAGPGASTTGTIYGIFDMNGGAEDFVMGVVEYDAQGDNTNLGKLVTEDSGFRGLDADGLEVGSYEMPNEKYYNAYKTLEPTKKGRTDIDLSTACNGKVCYGHCLSETKSWYNDATNLVWRGGPWYRLGGKSVNNDKGSGVFSNSRNSGGGVNDISTRFVLIP